MRRHTQNPRTNTHTSLVSISLRVEVFLSKVTTFLPFLWIETVSDERADIRKMEVERSVLILRRVSVNWACFLWVFRMEINRSFVIGSQIDRSKVISLIDTVGVYNWRSTLNLILYDSGLYLLYCVQLLWRFNWFCVYFS